jgi:hypothetical protein
LRQSELATFIIGSLTEPAVDPRNLEFCGHTEHHSSIATTR